MLRLGRKNRYHALILLMTAASFNSGCRTGGNPSRSPDNRGGSILTSIEGMKDVDKKRPGIAYNLSCCSGKPECDAAQKIKITGTPNGTGADEVIRFPGEKVKDGDFCSMEITATLTPEEAKTIIWTSKPKQEGLLYASNRSKVDLRKMSLQLYTLYTTTSPDALRANIKVKFLVPAGMQPPAATTLSAALECGGSLQFSSGNYVPATTVGEGTFIFNISAAVAKGKSCEKLTALESTTPKYGTMLKAGEVKFDDPKPQTSLDFGPVTLNYIDPQGPIDINTIAGNCLNFDPLQSQCKDVLRWTMPNPKNFWLAAVAGKSVAGQEISALVSYADSKNAQGFGLDGESASHTVAELSDSLKASSPTASKFQWWKRSLEGEGASKPGLMPNVPASSANDASIFMRSFTLARLTAAALAPHKLEPTELVGASIMHVQNVYLHGMLPVPLERLNTQTGPVRWAAVVEFKSGSIGAAAGVPGALASSQVLLITGPKDFFLSDSKDSSGQWFSWASFKKNPKLFALYSVKNAPSEAVPANANACPKRAATDYVRLFSEAFEEQLPGGTDAGTAMSQELSFCRVSDENAQKVVDRFANTEPEVSPHAWGWHLMDLR